jgi:hypothetical protein
MIFKVTLNKGKSTTKNGPNIPNIGAKYTPDYSPKTAVKGADKDKKLNNYELIIFP